MSEVVGAMGLGSGSVDAFLRVEEEDRRVRSTLRWLLGSNRTDVVFFHVQLFLFFVEVAAHRPFKESFERYMDPQKTISRVNCLIL